MSSWATRPPVGGVRTCYRKPHSVRSHRLGQACARFNSRSNTTSDTKRIKIMQNFLRTQLFVLGCVLIANQGAFAQTFASINGDTRDASGAVVAGAVVTAVNLGTNAVRS